MSEEFNIDFGDDTLEEVKPKPEITPVSDEDKENLILELKELDVVVRNNLEEGWVRVPNRTATAKEFPFSLVYNPEVAEEILIADHERATSNKEVAVSSTVDEEVNKLLNHIEANYDGELKKRILKYIKLVNYHPELMYPILQNDVRFCSKLEELNGLEFANMVLQADMLSKINNTLEALLIAVDNLTQTIREK